MPDNWGFVVTAYGLAALVLGAYWRYLRRREREISSAMAPRHSQGRGGKAAARKRETSVP